MFDSLDKKHARALVRSLDADDSGGIDARELRSFVKSHRAKNSRSIIKKGDAPDLVREKLRALLLRTEQKGTSLSSVFHALDEDDSGALSVNELLSGLSKLGIFDSLDKRDVQDLVKRDLDSDRNGNVSIKEFLAFCRNSKAPSSRKVEKGGDDEDLDLVAQTYEFSSDPDVRAIEKKLRRAAREVAARGGDVRLLASQYDRDNSGSIVRSDFVQFLMQLGLSLWWMLVVCPKIRGGRPATLLGRDSCGN